MRTELLQKIETHLQFLGYKTEWTMLHEQEEHVIAKIDATDRCNWMCCDLLGGVQMFTMFTINVQAKDDIYAFIRTVNVLNAKNGPLSYYVDEDNVRLYVKMFIMYYDRVSFGKQLEVANFQLQSNLMGDEMSQYMR